MIVRGGGGCGYQPTSSGMPVSEDEYDHRYHPAPPQQQQQPSAMSKAEQRRSNKPIMEKRRRARINHCLNELKTLILDAMKKDPARHSKLEKADILEMTVKHLQSVQRQQLTVAMATDPTVMNKFKSGFSECAGEVSRFISRLEGVDASVKQRLIAHLASCIAGLQQLSPFSFSGIGSGLLPSLAALHSPAQQGSAVVPEDVNNNNNSTTSRLQMPNGIQLIPSRLPTGELALLVPNSSQLSTNVLPFFTSTPVAVSTSKSPNPPSLSMASTNGVLNPTVTGVSIERSHPSAFTAVTRTHSPSQVFNRSQSPVPSADVNSDARRTNSPLPLSCSPDCSSSSCEDDDDDDDDDDSLISDSYLSPNSPLANKHGSYSNALHYQNNQPHSQPSHQTSFQPVLNSLHFKNTPSNTSSFKPYNQAESKKPHQQPMVTSTCPESSPEPISHSNDQPSRTGTYTEVKLELKTIPVSSNPLLTDLSTGNLDDSFTNHSSVQMSQAVTSSTPVQLPLSVITYNEKAQGADSPSSKTPVGMQIRKDPLDFSFRRTEKNVSVQDIFAWQHSGEYGKKRHLLLNVNDQGDLHSQLSPSSLFSPTKMPRLSLNLVSHNDKLLGSDGTSDGRTDTDSHLQSASDRLAACIAGESATPSSSSMRGTDECLNRDMWRPW